MADPELPYAQVIHRVLGVGADTDADADLRPDLSVLAGLTVTLTPSPARIIWTGVGGPITHVPRSITAVYDSTGHLRLTQEAEQEGVWLLASEHADMAPSGWTYTARWSLGALPTVSFAAPPGAVIDLTTVIPVPSSPGSQLTDWLAAVAAAQAAQAAAEAAAVEATEAVEAVSDGIPAAVADYLTANPPSGSPDATTLTKGIVRLAGDLGGTADAPTVPGLADKADADHTHVLADLVDFTEASQDVVGAMVAAAGGSYDDAAGTITLPTAGGADPAAISDAVEAYLLANPPAIGVHSAYYAVPTTAGAITLDPSNGDRQGVTLTGTSVVTLAGDGQLSLAINRSIAGYGVTFSNVTWETPPNIAAGTNVLTFVKFGAQWFGFCSGVGFDTEPPTTPTNLARGETTPSSVTVTWTASTDNVAIDGYEVSLNGGAWVDVFKVTSYTLTGLATGTHQVRVRARDIKFNYSPPATITVSTAGGGDTTAPVAGTLAASAIAQTSFTLTVTGASDAVGLHATPYAFSTDNGATWSAWQSSAVFNATGKAAGTAYQGRHKVQDAAGNVTVGTAITVTTPPVAFDPSTISGLTLWLKSESLSALADGASITSWTDSSGQGNHAVPGGGAIPAPTKSSSNGHPAASFVNATGSVLASPAPAVTPEGTLFVAVRRTAGAQVRLVCSTLQGFRVGIGGTAQWNATVQTTAGTYDSLTASPTNTSPTNAWGVVGARFSDSADTLSVQYNSAALQSTTATKQITGTGATTLIGNGSTSVAFDPFGGEIAEVLRYNVALTDVQMGQVLGYLRSKYGIA